MSARRPAWQLVSVAFAVALAATQLSAQRGGGGGGGGTPRLSRLETLTLAFTLEKAQKQQVKTILDTEHKKAAPLRDELVRTHAAIAAAVQAGKNQGEIDAAVQAYAVQATAMTQAEMKALADVMQALTKDQRANAAAVQTAFYMTRGIFLDKKWDTVPGTLNY